MKNTKTMISSALVLLAVACGKDKDNKKSNPEAAGTKPGPVQAQKIEMPKVNYPAAIVFEGGKGEALFDVDGSKHQASWRLYICLEKTAEPKAGQVTLDLAKLGSAIVQTSTRPTGEVLYSERLNQVVLNYTYTTTLSGDPANNYGYAYGKAAVEVQSRQIWEMLSSANDRTKHQIDTDFFNVKVTDGTIMQGGQMSYAVNGEKFYVSSGLDRFTYSEKDNRMHVIEPCEKARKPWVLLLGNEL